MDTAKIIQDSTGGYLAVSHHLHSDGRFKVNLATSTDLLTWHWVRELAGSNNGGASQPTIVQASNGGDVGGHYWWNCDRDRQQRGRLTNFNSWSTSAQAEYDNALLYWGVGGNIGDRDQAMFGGFSFGLVEGQYTKGDFGSWRTFVYDYQTGNADRTTIRTNGGSTAFANPTITALRSPNGRPALVMTLFIPSEGAAAGESGSLIYYRTY